MININKNDFETFNFTIILLTWLKKLGISEFNLYNLEKDLYYYKHTYKYKDLFINIKCDNKKILLDDTIYCLEICGCVYTSQLDKNIIHIINIDNISDNIIYDINKIFTIKELVNDYYIKKYIKLNMYEINLDCYYTILNGFYNGNLIERDLITDASKIHLGKIINVNNVISIIHNFNSKFLCNITNGYINKVNTSGNVGFVCLREKINGFVKAVNLYTNSTNSNNLNQWKNYCLLDNTDNKDIKFLKLTR